MQYTKLELLHVMFVLLSNFCWVMLQVILPVVLSKGQYLHFLREMHLFFTILVMVREVSDVLLCGVVVS